MRNVTAETMAVRMTVMTPMPAPMPWAELMSASMRPETLRPVAKNSAQMMRATMPANILPMLWNIARASLKIFLRSPRLRMISTTITKIHTMKSAAIVSSLIEVTTSFEKMIRRMIGSTGKMAYHLGASGASLFFTSAASEYTSSPLRS